jgi:hypothetical protein
VPPLQRLRRLLLERDGLVEGPEHGLFEHDPRTGALRKCPDHSVSAADRPVVFVHGMLGGTESLRAYLRAFDESPALRGRKPLVFRYPGNGSLARSGLFLAHEVARVVSAPERAHFICHSAGGLVFRYYAEVARGGFDRATLLATPNAGSDLTNLKWLVDLAKFAGGLGGGLTAALDRAVHEGRGEIALDLHPDSLFLRHLGRAPGLAARYHVYSGQYLSAAQGLALLAGFRAARRLVEERWVSRLEPKAQRRARRWLEGLRVPQEVLLGDLAVTARSALLPGAGKVTRTRLHHQALKTDAGLIREVLEEVAGGPGPGGSHRVPHPR